MPQMMPMKWLFMLMLLTITILSIISFIYFSTNYQIFKLEPTNIKPSSWNWKW